MHASAQFAGEAIVQCSIVIEYPPRVKSGEVSLYGILTCPPPSCACIAVPSRAESVTYSISDLAREFALTTRAIRFYEDEGLLAPRRSGRSRIYGERERVRIKLILRGKRLGLSLSEIRELLDLYDATRSERPQLVKIPGGPRRSAGEIAPAAGRHRDRPVGDRVAGAAMPEAAAAGRKWRRRPGLDPLQLGC